MKRWSFSVRQKLTVVVALCVVLPLLALTVWQAYVWKGEQIAARQAVLERETEALWSEAERAVELCRVSAQAGSTNTRLTDYLSALIWGKSVSNLDIYEFYNTDVASLERLVASNPDLYRLRIYTAADDALEMLPVVFTGTASNEQEAQTIPVIERKGSETLYHATLNTDEEYSSARLQEIMAENPFIKSLERCDES